MDNQDSKKILIVEDERALANIIKARLEAAGYKTFVCPDAPEALKYLKQNRPDLIWLDFYLPGKIDGLGFLREVRHNPKTKDLKVLVVSVSSGELSIQAARELGIVDFITKSDFDLENIIKKLDKYLGK